MTASRQNAIWFARLQYPVFSCSSTVNLQVENHYAAWLETMF